MNPWTDISPESMLMHCFCPSPLMLCVAHSWVHDHTLLVNALPWHWLVTLLLASAVQFYVGGTFYRSAWSGLKHGSSNMSVLVVLGTSAAFIYSCISMVGRAPDFDA